LALGGSLPPSLIRDRAIDRLKGLLNRKKGVDQVVGLNAGIREKSGLTAALINQHRACGYQVLDRIGQDALRF
jgi:hypothetical protein